MLFRFTILYQSPNWNGSRGYETYGWPVVIQKQRINCHPNIVPWVPTADCRTILTLLLVTGLRGVWIVEQPSSSLIAQHKRFRWLVRAWRKMNVRVTWTCFWKSFCFVFQRYGMEVQLLNYPCLFFLKPTPQNIAMCWSNRGLWVSFSSKSLYNW